MLPVVSVGVADRHLPPEHDPGLDTNKNIKTLLRVHFDIGLAQTYTTNLFPFIKPGKMDTKIGDSQLLVEAAKTYTMREIGLVEPKLVVCCGIAVSYAILTVLGVWPGNLTKAIESSPFRFGKSEYWAQSHPGSRGRNNRNRGGIDRVSQDWRRMSAATLGNVARS